MTLGKTGLSIAICELTFWKEKKILNHLVFEGMHVKFISFIFSICDPVTLIFSFKFI